MLILRLEKVTKTINGKRLFEKLNLAFDYGQMIFIVGETGCGKTTLLKMVAGLDTDYEGTITFQQKKGFDFQSKQQIAFIHQQFPLIPYYTVEENITLFKNISLEKMESVCSQLDIDCHLLSYPSQLSGGEKQRVAIARALVKDASLILADEPTSCLGEKQAEEVMALLKKQAEKSLVIVVTHHRKLADKYADYIYDITRKEGFGIKASKLKEEGHIHIPASFRVYSFFKKQLRVLWKDKIRYIIPLALWTLTGFVFLVGAHLYSSFSNHLLREEDKRLDSLYLQIEVKESSEDWTFLNEELQQKEARLLQPYHVILNKQRKTYALYVHNDPLHQQFYFEIIPLLHLDKDAILMNQLFYQKSGKQADQIYLQFYHQDKNYEYLLPLAQVVDDGSLYQTPKLYVSYDFCIEQWPDYQATNHFLYYLPQEKAIKQQLATQSKFSFLFEAQPEATIIYYYSTHMVHKLYLDIQQVYRPLILLLFFSFGITLASLQGLFFLYLLDYRKQEINTLQENGFLPWQLLYVSIHDGVVVGCLSFMLCVFSYFILFVLLPPLPPMFAGNIFYAGVGYAFIFILIFLVWACFYVWLGQNKKMGKTRR